MGIFRRLFKRSEKKKRLTGRVITYDRTAYEGLIDVEGALVSFKTSACMFSPFVGLEVVVEETDSTGQAKRVRLSESSRVDYTRLLEAQQIADRQAAEQARKQRHEVLRQQTTRRVIDPQIEARIEQDPGDIEAHLVYADLLQERGDPLGELIAAEHALEQATAAARVAALRQQVEALRDREEQRLGLSRNRVRVTWRRGLIEAARLGVNWNEPDDYGDHAVDEALVVNLLGSTAARFLRRLTIGMLSWEDYDASILALLGDVFDPINSLRELHVGDFRYPDEVEMSWYELGVVPTSLGQALPELRRLVLQAGMLQLEPIDMPRLEHFELRTGGLSRANLETIIEARWPRLRSLIVWFGDEGYGAECTLDDLEPILAGRGLDQLTALGICNAEFTDELCERLVEAKILPRLEVLDLSRGTLTDQGAQVIAENERHFAHLRRLDVSRCLLSERGIAALETSVGRGGCELDSSHMRDGGDGDVVYVAVGE